MKRAWELQGDGAYWMQGAADSGKPENPTGNEVPVLQTDSTVVWQAKAGEILVDDASGEILFDDATGDVLYDG
jgi:hypothetical protein